MIEVARGQLGQQPLPILLNQLHQDRLTGVLQLSGEVAPESARTEVVLPSVDQIYFRNGYPVAVLLQSGAEPLGPVMLEAGFLDRDRFFKAQVLRSYGKSRIGELMLQARLIDRTSLKEGLKAQVRRRLHLLFYLLDAAFEVFSGDHGEGLLSGEPLLCEPLRAIYYGVRRAWPEKRLAAELRHLRGQEFQLSAGHASDARRWLSPAEARVCELLGRGSFSLQEVLEVSGLPSHVIYALLYSFHVCSALETRAAVMSRPRRAIRPAVKVVEPPYQPTDEPLPSNMSPVPEPSRPVQLYAGEGQPLLTGSTLPILSGYPQRAPILPIVATNAAPAATADMSMGTAEPQPKAPPAPVEPPPPPPAEEPPRPPTVHRPAPPPLRTSLPPGRLPKP